MKEIECLFCDGKLRLDPRTGELTAKGGVMRLYCDACDIVFVISVRGKYSPKTSLIVSTQDGIFKSDIVASGFSTKTRVLKQKLEVPPCLQLILSEVELGNKIQPESAGHEVP